MFIKEADARRLFKKAYKGAGLRIGNDGKGIYLTGRTWYMYVFRENIPKGILGSIISLTGALPEEGEQWICSKDECQEEIYETGIGKDIYRRALEAQAEGKDAVPANMVLFDDEGRPYHVYASRDGLQLVPEEFKAMCSASNCEENEDAQGCFTGVGNWIYWLSSHMAFAVSPYTVGGLEDQLREIQEAQIV